MANPNLGLLAGMVQALGPICDRLVFVGGCATGLLLDDAGNGIRTAEHVAEAFGKEIVRVAHRRLDDLAKRCRLVRE